MDAQAAIIAAVYGYAGGSSGESAGIIHGIAQTSTAEMSTAAKAMMRPSSTDEPMTCMAIAGSGRAQCAADEQLVRALLDAGQSDVDHADGGYRQQ